MILSTYNKCLNGTYVTDQEPKRGHYPEAIKQDENFMAAVQLSVKYKIPYKYLNRSVKDRGQMYLDCPEPTPVYKKTFGNFRLSRMKLDDFEERCKLWVERFGEKYCAK